MTDRSNRLGPGIWLSGAAHAAVLATALFAFTSEQLPDAQEGIPVEVITDNQYSEITKGETTAAKVQPDAKPRADRVADTRQERDPGEEKQDAPAPPKRPVEMKVADADVPPPPPPPEKVADAKPEPAETAPPPPPSRPDTAREEAAAAAAAAAAAKAEAAAKAQAAAAKAEAAAKAQAEKAEAIKLAQREEAEEKAREEAEAKAEAAAKAKADAQAKARADAKAKALAEAKAEADAKAKAELDRKMKAMAEAEAKAEAKAKAEADAKAKAEAEHRKEVAEARAKARAEAKAKAVAEAKAEAEAKARRQAEAAEKFSPGDIRQLLSSKEPSRSSGATGQEVQRTASLGTATGSAQRLNPSQREQIAGLIREQLIRCWQPPIAVQSAAKPPAARVRIALRQDGTLGSEPRLDNSSSDPLFRSVADSALRAARRCAPLRIPAQFAPFYQDWKDLVVDFDPREMG